MSAKPPRTEVHMALNHARIEGPSLDAQANAVTLIRAQVRKLAAEGKLPEPKESAA